MENKVSTREREVLHLIAMEYTTDEISDMLFISQNTVKSHRRNLIDKLGVKNTAGLVRRGFELGILKTDGLPQITSDTASSHLKDAKIIHHPSLVKQENGLKNFFCARGEPLKILSLRSLPAVLALLFLGLHNQSYGQERCLYDILEKKNLEADPEYRRKREDLENRIQNFIKNNPDIAAGANTVTIPVVFQVIHNGDAVGTGENLSDAQIMAQLDQLNADYGRTNSDAGSTPPVFAAVAANTMIQFCLASTDPQGQPTTGIVRYNLNLNQTDCWNSDFIEQNIVIGRVWDRDKYLNIFTVLKIDGDDCTGSLLGYAYPPLTTANRDAAVHAYYTIGSIAMPNPDNNTYGRGRTVTHEVGHWLNLAHIWGNQGGCADDDGVMDTPIQNDANYGCPTHPSASCSNNGDMFMNYMDYVNDNCMNMFTAGQATRMMAAIMTSRPGLLNSQCGMTPMCDVNVTVNSATTGNTLASNSITTQNTVLVNVPTVFSAPNVNLNGGFEVSLGNCFEANNVGCAFNGVLNCDGGGGGGETGTCAAPYTITCGQNFQGNNTGGESTWSSYQAGNYTGLTGPEKIHTLEIPGNTTRTISLSGLSADLDLLVANTCNSETVFAGSATLSDPETVMVENPNANPVTIYIIVDGYDGATSAYTLSCN